MSGFPADKAELVALLLETIIFGIFFTLFLILVAISCVKEPNRLANRRFVLVIATVMMTMSIVHLVISFVRVIKGFTTGDPKGLLDPNSYLADLSNPLRSSKTLIYGLQTWLGDAVLVWRCYVVYDKALYVIIPTGIALLANVGLSIPILVSFYNMEPGLSFFSKGAWQVIVIVIFFFIMVFLNLFCTFAIVIKLWQTHQLIILSNRGRSLFPVIAVVIESGAIYTACVLSLVVTFLFQTNSQQLPLSMMTPLVGIVFCLIVLQIHFQMRVLKPTPVGMMMTMLFLFTLHGMLAMTRNWTIGYQLPITNSNLPIEVHDHKY